LIRWIARITTTRRAPVLLALGVIAVGLATQVPKINVDPSIDSLIASHEGAEDVGPAFEADFGDSSKTLVLLVEAEDILTIESLQYLHDLSGAVGRHDWVESSVSLTRTPMPRRVEADLEASGGLDELEAMDDENYDPDAPLEEEDDFEPAVVDALVALVEADPERFPGGFATLGSQLSLELDATPLVEGETVTPEDVEDMRLALSQTDLVEGRLISRDHTLAVSALRLRDGDSRETASRLAALEEDLAEHPAPEGMSVRLGGLPHLRGVIVHNIRQDQVVLVPMTLVVCMLLLAFFLRWFAAVVLPIAAVGITAVVVVGGMAVAGEPFNILNNIIPTLLIIIGISDSIHLIGRYREELARGDGAQPAGERTVIHMGVACLLTSVTTAVGLASLLVSKTVMLRHFGLTAAIGVMVAYVVTITFLPAVLTWIRPPKKPAVTKRDGGSLESYIENLTRAILKRPWAVLGVTAVLLAGTGYASTQLVVDHALLDQFDEDDPVYQTTRLLEDKLDGVRPLEVSLRFDDAAAATSPETLAALDEVLAWADAQSSVLSTMSPMRLLRQTLVLLSRDEEARTAPFVSSAQVQALRDLLAARGDSPLAMWLTEDAHHMRLQLKVRDVGAQETMRLTAELEGKLQAAVPSGMNIGFTGEAFDGSAGMDAVVDDLISSLALALVIIVFILALLFRSIRLGLLSIPPNLIPLVFTGAYMVWRDIPLNAATVIIFSISLGLAVDGTIHVLARFREETHLNGLSTESALILAARGTGRAIVVSCITLMAGFSVLLFSNFVPVQRFGELIAVTVGCTLFATLIVQPVLLKVAGGKATEKTPSG
jgi:hydrophobe/amphiphile efflux-3 (HAE3) family protein